MFPLALMRSKAAGSVPPNSISVVVPALRVRSPWTDKAPGEKPGANTALPMLRLPTMVPDPCNLPPSMAIPERAPRLEGCPPAMPSVVVPAV